MARERLFEGYLSTAVSVINRYDGIVPLSNFLKEFFSAHRKFGARDRRYITTLIYNFYRTGYAFREWPVMEAILASLLMVLKEPNELLAHLRPEWNVHAGKSLSEKMALLGYPFTPDKIFPWCDVLSDGIDAAAFAFSHLVQPDLFLRIRPGHRNEVVKKLAERSIGFEACDADCIRLANNTPIQNILQLNREAVIQDLSSQRVGIYLRMMKEQTDTPTVQCWDCCAGSGGKSILVQDIFPAVRLTVSDVRPAIIKQLSYRFSEAGISGYRSFVTDLSADNPSLNDTYDLIIADVPCTGSGTWGRTPEQLCFFREESIRQYGTRQQRIVSHSVPFVAPNGWFLYVTCSVFREENEVVAEYIRKQFQLHPVFSGIIAGYGEKADTMYAALFRKG